MKIENKDNKIDQLHQLIEQFEYNEKVYKSSRYDEANTRVDFIDKFFELLDWDVRNVSGYSEAYRDVVREDKITIKGKPKAPDYSFRIGGIRKFFVEAKKPLVNIREDIEPAFQIRRYSYTAKLPLAILTDFEEMAVYDTRIKPIKTDKASTARINYLEYRKYPDAFDFIYDTFSKPAILRGSFDKYVEDTKRKRGTSEVDKEFLKMIDGWRTDLARNIALRNKQLDIVDLNYAIQKVIDRIIFLRIAEDRQMEKYGTMQIAGKSKFAYQKITHLFQKANQKYNSGLFKVEDWLDNLQVDDKIICSIITSLYYPECPYELSVMPIEILGNIYEQFLGKTIRLTPSHQAKIEEKPEVRKAGGVYYTPKYIVDYIVENTVGEKIKSQTPGKIEKLRILDPACGSGSFLVGAYQYLIDYHLKYYTKSKNINSTLKKGIIYQVDANTYRLSIQEKQKILLNNIYGVDIDSQAVEVTKLSLLLKLMEDENVQSAGQLFKYSDLKLLPDLKDNVKCGNSLIGTDFYKDKQIELFSQDEIRKINAFDWETEFKEIMDSGGFDCVIGNPPYIHQRDDFVQVNDISYYKSHYVSSNFRQNTYTLFVEKGIDLLKKEGIFSYIIPNYFLSTDNDSIFREFLFTKNQVIKMLNVKNVFIDATVYCLIPIVKKDNSKSEILYYEKNSKIETLDNNISDSKIFYPSPDNSYKLRFIKRKTDCIELGKYCNTYMGIVPYRKGYGDPPQTEKMINNKLYSHKKSEGNKDLLYYTASDIGFFY
ncbi:MAG: hypothetical protein APR63_13220, partial [Desulfuromonas sp. SDB]